MQASRAIRLVAIAQQLARLEAQKLTTAPAGVQSTVQRKTTAKRGASRRRSDAQTGTELRGNEGAAISAGISFGSGSGSGGGQAWDAQAAKQEASPLQALVGVRVSVLRGSGATLQSFIKVYGCSSAWKISGSASLGGHIVLKHVEISQSMHLDLVTPCNARVTLDAIAY